MLLLPQDYYTNYRDTVIFISYSTDHFVVRTNFINLYESNISSGSQFQAEHTADALRSHTDRELEENTDLADRLRQLELPPDITFLGNESRIPTPEVEVETPKLPELAPTQLLSTIESHQPQSDVPEIDTTIPESFNEIIALSRVYKRVQGLEIDAMSTTLSTRSHGWSVLSGMTSARLTTIGVICLPLHTSELERFLAIGSLQTPLHPATTIRGPMTNASKRLHKELTDLNRDPSLSITAGPIGDNMVCTVTYHATGIMLTVPQVSLASCYYGPSMFCRSSRYITNNNLSPNQPIQVVFSSLQLTF